MKLQIFQVDAFTDRPFGGNPAAVVPLREWLPGETMQAIALENNLSETAFFVPRGDGEFDLRWFTPLIEVDLCGHATLATAWVLLNRLGHTGESIAFHTRSGPLTGRRALVRGQWRPGHDLRLRHTLSGRNDHSFRCLHGQNRLPINRSSRVEPVNNSY